MLPSFKNASLLSNALTHRSALNEGIGEATTSNERLEFLGDAVLELATTTYLFRHFPTEPEGNLTAYRSALVKTTTLAELAEDLSLGKLIYMSKGEEATGGRQNPSLLADTMEAVIGALYLDQGFDSVDQFLHQSLFPKLVKIKEERLYKDPKSELQELVQAQGFEAPLYEVVEEAGPDHDKQFTIQVKVGDVVKGSGTGRSKQLARQAAAAQAIETSEWGSQNSI